MQCHTDQFVFLSFLSFKFLRNMEALPVQIVKDLLSEFSWKNEKKILCGTWPDLA